MTHVLTATHLFDLHGTLAAPLFAAHRYPWEVLDGIEKYIISLGQTLPAEEYVSPATNVWVHRTAQVASSVFWGNAIIIGAHTEVRHNAFLRGNALVGCHAVVGNATELKNAILFDRVQVPHYNYVGDSILGIGAHLGAGTILSNVKSDKTPVTVLCDGTRIATHRRKCGAFLGDRTEIGCGSVLNPGSVIGRDARVAPLSAVRGYVPERHIYKQSGEVVPLR